jgi:rRNA maturation RNase YbeY
MVLFQNRLRSVKFHEPRLTGLVNTILSEIGESASELSLSFVGDQRMRGLNRRYRGKDRTTDVLAFAVREGPMVDVRQLGDVVISVPTAIHQAKEDRRSIDAELTTLLIHGILHLCGYDHERSKKEARRMQRRERTIFRKIGRTPRLMR